MNTIVQDDHIDTEADAVSSFLAPAVERVVLIGFMGAGKTTIGRLLAQKLGWEFTDIDHEVEAKVGRTVGEIFRHEGEFVFRHLESSAIARALGARRAVVALGGGAPEVLTNRLLLEQTPRTAVVFLDAPFGELVARCERQGGAERPVLADAAIAEERFRYRAPLYRRCAKVQIATSGKSPEQTAMDIIQRLR